MLISKKVLNQIQTQFDYYYFRQYQKIRKEKPNMMFSLEHQSRKMVARFSHHETGILLNDQSLIETITDTVRTIQITYFKGMFSKNTDIKFNRMFDNGNFEFSFSNEEHQGVMIANSEELYILLSSNSRTISKIMYQITKENDRWNFLEYYFDGKEFFPIGKKCVIAITFPEAVHFAQTKSFEEIVPSDEIINKTLHLYHISGLKEYFESPHLFNHKQYYLTQK